MVEPIGCLTCHQRIACRHGCCLSCYDRHWRAVRAGKTTWAKLEKQGLAAPVRPSGERWMPKWK
jgi:hypothetical protein